MFRDKITKKPLLFRRRPGSVATISPTGEGSMEIEFVDVEGNVVSGDRVVLVLPFGNRGKANYDEGK